MNHTIISPINSTNTLKPFLECKDYTVSNELFTLLKDTYSELLITTPQPKLEDLSAYYKSEAYISHTDASTSLFDKVYQLVKTYAIKKKVKLIANLTTGSAKTILDVGCGTGDFLRACQNNNWQVAGVEPNKRARDLAKKS